MQLQRFGYAETQTLTKVKWRPKSDPLQSSPSNEGLLVASSALALLSLNPAYRVFSSLALRSIALFSASASLMNNEDDDKATTTAKCLKVAALTLGIATFAFNTPTLIVASLTIDACVQGMELVKSEGGIKTWTHLTTLISNVLIMKYIQTPAYSFALLAIGINAVALIVISGYTTFKSDQSIISKLCYVILAGVSAYQVGNMLSHNIPKTVRLDAPFTNTTDKELTIYDGDPSQEPDFNRYMKLLRPGDSIDPNQYGEGFWNFNVIYDWKLVDKPGYQAWAPDHWASMSQLHTVTVTPTLSPQELFQMPVGGIVLQ